MDGAFDGALQAGFLAAEAVQEPIRAGIALGNEGEAAGVVKVAIPFVVLDRVFVLVPVEGDFHALNPRAAPGGHDDLADEGFLGGVAGWCSAWKRSSRHRIQPIFAGQDEGFRRTGRT